MALCNLVGRFQSLALLAAAPSITTLNITSHTARSLCTSCVTFRKLDNRAYPVNKSPSSKNERWVVRKPFSELYEYTTEPLPFPKTGGRGPNGRKWNHRRAGGFEKKYTMVQHFRGGPHTGPPLEEKVDSIIVDENRTAHLALVASGENKRYIIATQYMKAGDVIKSSQIMSKTAIRGKDGDAFPVGSLPIGSIISNVERHPGQGAEVAISAGTQAQLIRKIDDQCVIRMPSKREMLVSSTCMATIGRVSNINHNKKKFYKFGQLRWMGIKQRSGRYHRKTGRFGRKIHSFRKIKVYGEKRPSKKAPPIQMTDRFINDS